MMLATKANGEVKLRHVPETSDAMELLADRKARLQESDAASQANGYARELYRTLLLSKDEECTLFERMDELRVDATELRVMALDLQCEESAHDLSEIEQEIELIRNHLIESNLRLVVSVARKFRSPETVEFHDLISEGNAILMKAVDLFKVKYGYRFSTYATTALKRGLYNYCHSDYRRKTRFVSGQTEKFDGLKDDATPEAVCLETLNEISAVLATLDKREKKIVVDRFGLRAGAKGKTFRELGEELELSKERIRQIMGGALEKMRNKMDSRKVMACN